VVIVVGDVIVDVVVRPLGPFNRGSDTPSRIALTPGGSASNQAVALAAAGAQVHLVGVVGDDDLGRAAARALVLAGVQAHLRVALGHQTGVVVAVVDASGQRSMLTDRGANLRLAAPAGTSTSRATSCSTRPLGRRPERRWTSPLAPG
jgi:sugar/nucleoside kinase (ribokinase family)